MRHQTVDAKRLYFGQFRVGVSDRSGDTPDHRTRFTGQLFSNDYIDVAGFGGHRTFTVHDPVSLTDQNGHLLQSLSDILVVHHVHGLVHTQKLLLNTSFYDNLHIEVTRATPKTIHQAQHFIHIQSHTSAASYRFEFEGRSGL